MSIDPPAPLVFVSLLRDPDDAAGLSSFLQNALLPEQSDSVSFATAPVRGLDFLADEGRQKEVDEWWARTVPSGGHPIYLVMHEDGLEQWVAGLDGTFYIGTPDSAAELGYSDSASIRTFAADGPIDFAEAVMRDFSGLAAIRVFEEEAVQRIAALNAGLDTGSPPPGAVAALEPLSAHPFDLLIQAQSEADNPCCPAAAPVSRPPVAFTWPLRRRPAKSSPRDVGRAAVDRGPTIVVVGSRKGGVGKTSHAAGVAIIAGEALDLFGHRAAIVDANIANPDAWGHLNLPRGAATVREVVAALTTNRDPPPPVHAASPALACYPEAREATEYSKTDISRVAQLLRSRYTFIVVDMSNRLPDPLGGPEAAAAAYWLEHGDVLVLPTASSKEDFNGVLDYLDVGGLPPTVVPYIVPGMRRNREHPLTRQYLTAIRDRVQSVVSIPDEADKVRYASMEGVPVQQVSPALRGAYRELFEAIVRVPHRIRG